MKRVFIIHGWSGSPNEPMHVWLKEELEKNGFKVVVPKMPDRHEPDIGKWVGHINNLVGEPDEETFFIGHSIGCQAILRYLVMCKDNTKVGGVTLIAPWMSLDENTIKEEGEESVRIAKPWVETPIDFEKIKKITTNITAIFSDNDPYVPYQKNKKLFEDELDARTILEHNKGHFTKGDGVRGLNSALNMVLDLFK